MSRLDTLRRLAGSHKRLLVLLQVALVLAFIAAVTWAVRGEIHAAADDLAGANLVLFGLACGALAAYYLVFVLGWMWILAEWGIRISYPAALRAEMLSMVAK